MSISEKIGQKGDFIKMTLKSTGTKRQEKLMTTRLAEFNKQKLNKADKAVKRMLEYRLNHKIFIICCGT